MTTREEPDAPAGPLDEGFLPIERRLLRLSFGDQRGFLVLRMILAAVLLLQAASASPRASIVPAAYALAAVALFLRSRGRAGSPGPATFLLDVGASLAVLRLTEGSGSHVYTALLLLILGSTFLRKPILIFAMGLAVSLAYAFLAFPSPEDLPRVFPLHLALFLLVALFAVHIADYAAAVERQTARRYEERLAWMQRLSMVGRAMAAVLHEAKTPMATIVLNAESAQELLGRGEDPAAEMKVIAEEADHATAILQNFLDFVKPTRLDLQPLDLREPLRQAAGMARIRLDEGGVALELDAGEECPVSGSARHLVQAFSNVINNAIDAMPEGGKLSVRLAPAGGRAVAAFADTGVGLSARALETLYEPFASSKRGDEGHGLGLSIVRWIVAEHGGTIEVASPGPGRGVRVAIALPLARS